MLYFGNIKADFGCIASSIKAGFEFLQNVTIYGS
jgi:hypothetical protein